MALSLPFTLTNGTLADANQVMADFNAIVSFVNSINLLDIPVSGSASNVKAGLSTAGTTVAFTADNVVVGTALNGTQYTLTSFSQSFNSSTTGAGGMDTGTLPTSGYVAIYAIFNPATPATSILGTNAASSAPTIYAGANMPAGYTASALLGIWPTNATPAMVPGYVRNRNFQYQTQAIVLNASTTAHASLTSLSISSGVPTSAINASFLSQFAGNGSQAQTGYSSFLSSDSTASPFFISGLMVAAIAVNYATNIGPIDLVTSQTIWYTAVGLGTNVNLTIGVSGFGW
jgi:hypothetical protein